MWAFSDDKILHAAECVKFALKIKRRSTRDMSICHEHGENIGMQKRQKMIYDLRVFKRIEARNIWLK
ncbi:hypothetical protein B1J94_05710 [Leptospira kirschneri serovar Grippotyphosa]|nr:hypothetical protein B1J94_05710 [Leptospira kirschneri serovar Grippotyphosa]